MGLQFILGSRGGKTVHRASGRSNGEQRYEEADLCRCAGAVYNANTKKSCRIE